MLPILVVHGATDEATSQPMAELLAALREQGANPAYKEVPKAAKEGINWVPELYAWLKLQLNK
jgi:predicted esterase